MWRASRTNELPRDRLREISVDTQRRGNRQEAQDALCARGLRGYPVPMAEERKLDIRIAYCVRCNFLARTTWVAQELLHTYADYTAGLTLIPSSGGLFEVTVNGDVVFSNKTAGRYPEIRELKEALNRYLEAEEVATLKRHPGREA